MKFKQFLNEVSYKEPKEYKKYSKIFSDFGITLNDGRWIIHPYDEILKDKNFVGYFNYEYFRKFGDGTLKNSIDLTKNKIYYDGDKKLYSYNITNKRLNDFVSKNNLIIKLIGVYNMNKQTEDLNIGGIVCVFKRKSTSKHLKQLNFESINENTEDNSILFDKLSTKFKSDLKYYLSIIPTTSWGEYYGIKYDKKSIGYVGREILYNYGGSYKGGIDLESKKLYHSNGEYKVYSYDISNNELKKFSKINNIEIKLISDTDIKPDTREGIIGGIVVIFRRKYSDSKYIKQLNFESINEEVYDPSILKVIFLAGSPGSGKTYIADKVTSGLGFKKLNIDDVLEHRFTKNKLHLDFEKHSPEFVDKEHNIAREKTSKRRDVWVDGRLGLIIDGTGKNFDAIKSQINDFKKLGYDEMMIFVNSPLETSLKRNETRNRKVNSEMLKDYWHKTQENIDKYKDLFGNKFILIDNVNLDDNKIKDIWKKIYKFSKSPVENIIGKNWIEHRRREKNIKHVI